MMVKSVVSNSAGGTEYPQPRVERGARNPGLIEMAREVSPERAVFSRVDYIALSGRLILFWTFVPGFRFTPPWAASTLPFQGI